MNFDQFPKIEAVSKIPKKEKLNPALDEAGVYEMIRNAPPINWPNEEPPPFDNYDKNTDELWEYVSPEKVSEYLDSKLFFETFRIDSKDKTLLTEIHKRGGDSIEIPIDLVVCAAGFDDWRGRGEEIGKDWHIKNQNGDVSRGTMKSRQVVKLYAGTPSELPAVEIMNMYIQPNKTVFFDNNAGDSHRIAAAILRGDKFIKAENLYVHQLYKDYI